MDLCISYTPLPTARTMRELERARFVVSTSNVLDHERGRRDPVTRLAQDDIEGLMDRMASGEDRLLEFSMRYVVRGSSRDVLLNRATQVRATLQSMLLKSQPCWFEQDKAFPSMLAPWAQRAAPRPCPNCSRFTRSLGNVSFFVWEPDDGNRSA